MFTGLVETTGLLRRRRGAGAVVRVFVETELGRTPGPDGRVEPLVLGESVCVHGACLTVDRIVDRGFEVDMSAETVKRTTLGELPAGSRVHLERATPAGGRLGGHVVLGHVDGIGRVVERTAAGEAIRLVVEAPVDLGRFLAEKGSITVDGVSLTINGVRDDGAATRVELMLIPHTLGRTTLCDLRPGARVNLEVDVLARYVARQLSFGARGAHEAEGHGRGEVDEGDGRDDARFLEKLRSGGFAR
jgi:riboflavin synthase